MKELSFDDLQAKHGGKFVAILNNEKVVASGDTFNEVLKKVNEMKMLNISGMAIRFIKSKKEKVNYGTS